MPTLSWDLETLPLWSRSSAVKACQMPLSSSSFKLPMAAALLLRLPQLPRQPLGASDAPLPLPPLPAEPSRDLAGPLPARPRPLGARGGTALRRGSAESRGLPIHAGVDARPCFPARKTDDTTHSPSASKTSSGHFRYLHIFQTRAPIPRKNM